ncbi:MAG: MFS transporter, partial [Deltaproteobacteria bacterium]
MPEDHFLSSEARQAAAFRVAALACLGAFMTTLDAGLVLVALPRIALEFRIPLHQVSWILVVLLLASIALQLVITHLGDLVNPGRFYLAGVGLFALASALCSQSSNLEWLLGFRVLEGAGAAAMVALAPKLLSLVYPAESRGLSLGFLQAAFAGGAVVGVLVGGVIVYYWDWPLIFILNPVVGLLVLIGGAWTLWRRFPVPAEKSWKKLDWLGSLLLTAGLILSLVALEGLRHHGAKIATLSYALAGLVALGMFFWWENRHPQEPLLPPKLWRLDNIQGFASAILGSMVYFGAFFLLPFFLTQQDKFSYYHAGFLLAAVSGSSMLASPMSGYGSDRWGGLWVCRLGSLVLLGAALFLFLALKGASTPELLGHFVFLGIGYALFYTPAFNS